jgi:N-acetylmuramate 1-kinase
MSDTLLNFVVNNLSPKPDPGSIKIEKLFGQASYRQYFRATCDVRRETYIIMQMPSGFSAPAEEITKETVDKPKELPFINVNTYLKKCALPVPTILAFDEDKGLILLEDLGEATLEALYKKAGPEFGQVYYKNAIDLLIALQTKTNEDKNCVAYHRCFDLDLLNHEFKHFLDYGVEDRLDKKLDEATKETFLKTCNALSQTIAQMPQGFTHRDFQSRNLMFKNFDFFLIDFQDALVGPILYDLVALLRDSYVTFSPIQRDHLINYYCEKLPETHSYYNKKDKIFHDFHLIALQRKLKDAGRFQFINTVKKNPHFLKNIPQSLAYVKEALDVCATNKHVQSLHSWLKENVKEFS